MTCCNRNCDQGRTCPARRPARELTPAEARLLCVLLLAAFWGLVALGVAAWA